MTWVERVMAFELPELTIVTHKTPGEQQVPAGDGVSVGN
jgi:hypothetical protein